MLNEHTSSKSKKDKQKLEDERKEALDRYFKSIEPYMLMFFCFFVIPDMVARFEASDKSADEDTHRN